MDRYRGQLRMGSEEERVAASLGKGSDGPREAMAAARRDERLASVAHSLEAHATSGSGTPSEVRLLRERVARDGDRASLVALRSTQRSWHRKQRIEAATARDTSRPLVGTVASPPQSRLVRAALVGLANAGKSTLANALSGTHVSAVSSKSQTTRDRRLAVFTDDDVQCVVVDTPGVVTKEEAGRMQYGTHGLTESAWQAARDAHVVLAVVDAARRVEQDLESMVQRMADLAKGRDGPRCVLVLTKADRLVSREALLRRAHELSHAAKFERVFLVSAQTGFGLDDLRRYLRESSVDSPWMFAADTAHAMSRTERIAEAVREAVFLRTNGEIPHAVAQRTVGLTSLPDGSLRVDQALSVDRVGQRRILVGHEGSVLKFISEHARKSLAAEFGCKVHLFIHVKIRKHAAMDDESRMN